MEFAGDDVESQTQKALKNIEEILSSAGLNMRNIVKTTILLADINDFPKVNKIYEKCKSFFFLSS